MYLLDTNHVLGILKGEQKVGQEVANAIASGDRVLVSAIAYYETRRGYLKVNALAKLKTFETFCKALGVALLDTISIFDRAAQVWADLENAGRAIPDADILIGATALEGSFVVLARDQHFDHIRHLQRKNWLA